MRKAIFYLTFNGIFNDTNGIGTQTINMIQMLTHHKAYLESKYGAIDFYIICPNPNKTYWGYNTSYFQQTKETLKKANIHLYLCELDNEKDLWTVYNWQILCTKAATYIRNRAKRYSRMLAICIDTPYIQVGRVLLQHEFPVNLNVLLVLYGGTYLTDSNLDKARLRWEIDGIKSVKDCERIKIADVGDGMTALLKEKYGCCDSDFLPYKTGIVINSSVTKSSSVVPTVSVPIILAFGRAHPNKGFEDVIMAAAKYKSKSRLILIAPGDENSAIMKKYKKLRKQIHPEMLLITEFNRELPKSIIQSKNICMVVCPSHKECFSNIPLEVSVFGKKSGAVLLCRDIPSYTEPITNSYNGFIFSDESDLVDKMGKILQMTTTERKQIATNAYHHVTKNYSLIKQFEKLLNSLNFQS